MTGIELVLFASLLGWMIAPELTPLPCYRHIDDVSIPFDCEDLNNVKQSKNASQ